MRILLINPPPSSFGSRIPRERLPSFDLRSVGGPLIDAGHEVRLLDVELGPLSVGQIAAQAAAFAPDAVLISHSGPTSGHLIVAETTRAIRRSLPKTWIIYAGVFPTYHWREILTGEPQINFIVRGAGAETATRLIHALEIEDFFPTLPGIAYWYCGRPFSTSTPVLLDILLASCVEFFPDLRRH